MELKLYKIISGPPNVLTQYGFDMIPDRDFLWKTLILGTIFFGTPGNVNWNFVKTHNIKGNLCTSNVMRWGISFNQIKRLNEFLARRNRGIKITLILKDPVSLNILVKWLLENIMSFILALLWGQDTIFWKMSFVKAIRSLDTV